jgi:hypothetical protein
MSSTNEIAVDTMRTLRPATPPHTGRVASPSCFVDGVRLACSCCWAR